MNGYQVMTKLLWMRLRANLRQRAAEMASLRGALSLLTIAVFVGAMVYWSDGMFASSAQQVLGDHPDRVSSLLSWGVLLAIVTTVMSGSGPPIYYNHAEVNLLWSAPISRSWLVYYKLCGYTVGAAMTALLLALLLSGNFTTGIVRFFTLLLTMVFVQIASTALRMFFAFVRQATRNQFSSLLSPNITLYKYWLLGLVLVLILVTVLFADQGQNFATRFAQLPVVTLLLSPFSIVADLMMHSNSGRDLAINCSYVLGMIGVMTGLIVVLDKRLDQYMLEASSQANQIWSKALRSGNLMSRQTVVAISGRPPRRLMGVGPMLWSRWLYAMRSSGHTMFYLLVAAGISGGVVGTALSEVSNVYLASAAFFVSLYFLPRALVFDFRSTPELMETLRGLPVSASVICLSQVLVPVTWKTVIELSAVTALAISSSRITAMFWLAALCFLPVVNFLIVTLDNIFFLLRPTRLLPVGRMDFDFLGRTLLEFLVKSIALSIVVGTGLVVALWILRQWGGGPWGFAVSLYGVMILCCIGALFILSSIFNRVDVSHFDRL